MTTAAFAVFGAACAGTLAALGVAVLLLHLEDRARAQAHRRLGPGSDADALYARIRKDQR